MEEDDAAAPIGQAPTPPSGRRRRSRTRSPRQKYIIPNPNAFALADGDARWSWGGGRERARVMVRVKTFWQDEISIPLRPSDTVEHVMQQIAKSNRTPPRHTWNLTYNARSLWGFYEDATLESLGIKAGDEVTCIVRRRYDQYERRDSRLGRTKNEIKGDGKADKGSVEGKGDFKGFKGDGNDKNDGKADHGKGDGKGPDKNDGKADNNGTTARAA